MKPMKIKKNYVSFFPTVGHQTVDRPNRADLLNITQDFMATPKVRIPSELDHQNSIKNSTKESKKNIVSKILEESSKDLKNRSSAYEGGNNDAKWKEIIDNDSINGGHHSD